MKQFSPSQLSANALVVPWPRPGRPGSSHRPRQQARDRRPAGDFQRQLAALLASMPTGLGSLAVLGCAVLLISLLSGTQDLMLLAQFCFVPVLTSALSSVIVTQGMHAPLRAVAKAAKRISSGDRSVRVARTGSMGEIASLVESFNAMAEAIDMRERERSQVTAGVSHELRTPLTILKSRLHAIRDGVIDGTPDDTERLLRQVDHILRIVDDLDTLAHTDTGRLILEREFMALEDVVGTVVADLQPLLARHGLTVQENYRRVQVLGDRHRLRQVFTNLLTNAAKHSPPGGKVGVTVDIRDGLAVACVTDEGPGIAPGDEEHLFKPFWRSAATRKRPGCTGSGLGLALTARLVRAHGGRVEAVNRADRSGASFRVVLPLAQVARAKNCDRGAGSACAA